MNVENGTNVWAVLAAKRALAALPLSMAVCLLWGCPSSEEILGEEGNIRFEENNVYLSLGGDERSVSLTDPIVVGGLLHISVRPADASRGVCQVEKMEPDDPEIVEYTGVVLSGVLEPDHNLRARSAGQTRLRVTLKCDEGREISDSILLRVRKADSHRITRVDERPFIRLGADDTEGEAFRPNTKVRFAVHSRAGSTDLIGIGGYALRHDEDHVEVSKDFGDGKISQGTANTFTVEVLGQSGATSITTNLDGRFDLYTLAEDDPLTLGVYDTLTGELIERVTDNLDGVALAHIAAKDMENRLVVPSRDDKKAFDATLSDGIEVVEMEVGGGAVGIRACPGTAELTAAWFGQTITVPVEITEGVNDPMCE